MPVRRFVALAGATGCLLGAAHGFADTDTGHAAYRPVEVELTAQDLDAIKAVMVKNAPVLASSPGIKHASAEQYDGITHANVIFHPHEVIGGIGRAVNAQCQRTGPDAPWTCPSGSLRLYVQIPGQTFQVRVIGNIEYNVAMALIDATRETLSLHPDYAAGAPDTAVMIFSNSEHVVTVGWGDSEGYLEVNVEAALIEGRDPRSSRSWRVVKVAEKPYEDPRHGITQT